MSYADMITILMAFFVVMYSMAGTPDEAKEAAVFRSLREQFGPMLRGWQAMGHGPTSARPNGPMEDGWQPPKHSKGGAENRGPSGEYPRVHSLSPGEQEAIGGMVYFTEGSSTLSEKQPATTTNHRRGIRGQTAKNRNPGTHLAPAAAAGCPVSRQLGPGLRPMPKRPGLSQARWDSIQDASDSAWRPKTNRAPRPGRPGTRLQLAGRSILAE